MRCQVGAGAEGGTDDARLVVLDDPTFGTHRRQAGAGQIGGFVGEGSADIIDPALGAGLYEIDQASGELQRIQHLVAGVIGNQQEGVA